MRPRVVSLAVLAAVAAACGGDPPSDAEVRRCLEDAGADVRGASDRGDGQLVPKEVRALYDVTLPDRRRPIYVMLADDDGAAEEGEDALRDILPNFSVEEDHVRREGRFIVLDLDRPPTVDVMDCVS